MEIFRALYTGGRVDRDTAPTIMPRTGWWRHSTRFGMTSLGLVGQPSLQWSKPPRLGSEEKRGRGGGRGGGGQ